MNDKYGHIWIVMVFLGCCGEDPAGGRKVGGWMWGATGSLKSDMIIMQNPLSKV